MMTAAFNSTLEELFPFFCYAAFGAFLFLLGGNIQNRRMPNWFKLFLFFIALGFYFAGAIRTVNMMPTVIPPPDEPNHPVFFVVPNETSSVRITGPHEAIIEFPKMKPRK